MPDLTTETGYTCRSNLTWYRDVPSARPGVPDYVVTFGPCAPTRKVMADFACTCRDFVHRKRDVPGGYCKHVLAVRHERCGWSTETGGAPKVKDGKPACPECGGPAQAFLFKA